MSCLNENQELMLDSVKAFCKEELTPDVIAEIENEAFPESLIGRMRDLGLPSLLLPEEYGGSAESMVCKVAIEKEIAKYNMSAAIIGTDCSVADLLLKVGTNGQKEKYLPEIIEKGAGFGFTEPTAGSDASGIQTTATRDEDGWIINGQKTFISFVNQCQYFLVSARTSGADGNGISAFLVSRDLPGFKVGSIFHKIGMKGSDTGELFFEDMHVPADAMVGPENKGLGAVLALLDEARLGTASVAVGIAEAAIEKASEFAKERIAFGGPIAKKQGIQWYFAEMDAKTSAARALLYEVASDFDQGKNITAGAAKAKWLATQTAIEVTGKAMQICGGYGLTNDFGIERLYRDAKVCSIIEGTDEILKIVISRATLH